MPPQGYVDGGYDQQAYGAAYGGGELAYDDALGLPLDLEALLGMDLQGMSAAEAIQAVAEREGLAMPAAFLDLTGQGLDGLEGIDLASLQGLDIPGLESLVKDGVAIATYGYVGAPPPHRTTPHPPHPPPTPPTQPPYQAINP